MLAAAGMGHAGGAQASEPAGDVQPAARNPNAGRPNVLLIILDDVGFADLGCYGGEIPTPAIDSLAAAGLRYTSFRTSGVCSATRASLLTGLNPHSAGIGWLTFADQGLPGYRGQLAPEALTLAETMNAAGFATYHVGKWHVNLANTTNSAGPIDNWPARRGYMRSYWFQGHSTDFYTPAQLYAGTDRIQPAGDDYYVTDDFTDRAIHYLRDHKAQRPEAPFFMTLAHPAAHTPLHARTDDVRRFQGAYDEGWDVIRARRLARQKALGLFGAEVQLPPHGPGVRSWSDHSREERAVFARYMEVYAAMIARLDWNVGRLLAALRELDELDNTLILLLSDNGGSPDGGLNGTINLLAGLSGGISIREAYAARDRIGGPDSYPAYPMGWAMASNTPFRLYKHDTHLGGVADPLIVHWPRAVSAREGLRRQDLHAVDVFPTIVECADVTVPTHRLGRAVKPVEGRSFAATFSSAEAPSPRQEQYFELTGLRALRSGNWRLVSKARYGAPGDGWELFDTIRDVNELNDLAANHPELVSQLDRKWMRAARRHNVLPIDSRPQLVRSFEEFFRGGDQEIWSLRPPVDLIPEEASPPLFGRTFEATMGLQAPAGAVEGVLFAYGSQFLGMVAYVQDGRLVFEQNCLPRQLKIQAAFPRRAQSVAVRQTLTSRPYVGILSLLVDDREVARSEFDRLFFGRTMQGLQVGRNDAVAASPSFRPPFPFTGAIESMRVRVDQSPYGAAEIANIGRARTSG